MAGNVRTIEPQIGFQTDFLATMADIAIGGAAAGVGKTYVLLMEPLRHKHVKDFGAVTFRRTSPQIKSEGALWDTSTTLYPLAGGIPKESSLEWFFGPSKVKFSHLEYEKNVFDWQGSQIPLICFDELTHFTKRMFFYLLTRNRSTCGVNPYVRATCNPDPDSWLADFIAWWIDQETGMPIPERNGVLRYMVVDGDSVIWGNSVEEVVEKAWYMLEAVVEKSGIDPKEFVKSVTFISGSIYDNKKLLEANPAYLGNLLSQDEATQAALLHGSWRPIVNENDIYEYNSFRGMFENAYEVDRKGRYITADIAMKGSDKFVVGVWYGYELVDILIMPKSNGKQIVDAIKDMAAKHKVQNHHVAFDNDGVGSFIDGFIVGAKEFNNGSAAIPDPANKQKDLKGNVVKPNYFNLKTQCYYRSGDNVNKGLYRISEEVANRMYDSTMTIRQRFLHERKAIKRAKADFDGKLRINGKDEMKVILGGESPDMMDMFMMREIFGFVKTAKWA